jgi:thiol-disulfide isomerase/thioredoxin
MQSLAGARALEELLGGERLVLVLFKTQHCSVCDAVQPQVEALLERYAGVRGAYLYMEDAPELAAVYMIFTSPVVLLMYEGKEVYRAARFVRFAELEHQVSQYASLLDADE